MDEFVARTRTHQPPVATRLIRRLAAALTFLGLMAACTAGDDGATPSGTEPAADTTPGTTYHVSPDGDDNNDGTQQNPWQNLQTAADQLMPGDTLMVHEGSYPAPLIITAHGDNADGFVTIQAAPGEAAIIDAIDTKIGKGFFGLIQIRNGSHIRIDGFEITNGITDKSKRNPVGIFVSGQGDHIELLNNDIHTLAATSTTGQRDAHGIAVYGTSEEPITDVLVAGNKVHDLILGTSEALVINGNVDRFVVEDNEVYNNDNIGIDVIGFEGKSPIAELDQARNGIIRNNLVYGIDTLHNPTYGERNAGGIYVDGGADILIEDNVVHHSNMGIEIASESGTGTTIRITVRNNHFYANHITGLAMGGYDHHRGSTQDCVVTGNRFERNDTDDTGWGELVMQFDIRNNTITDNVFIAGPSGRFFANGYLENEGSVVNNNTYISNGEPTWQWKAREYDTFEDYQAGSENDADSTFRTTE